MDRNVEESDERTAARFVGSGQERGEEQQENDLSHFVAPEMDRSIEEVETAAAEVGVAGGEEIEEEDEQDDNAAECVVEAANEVWTALLPELHRYYDEDMKATFESLDCNCDTLSLGSMDLLTLVSLSNALDETIEFLQGGRIAFRTVDIDFGGSDARTWGLMAMAIGQDVVVNRLWRIRTCLASVGSLKCLSLTDLDPSECGMVAEFFLGSTRQVKDIVLTLKGGEQRREEDDSRCTRLRESLSGHGDLERFTLIVGNDSDFPVATHRLCSALSSCPELSEVRLHRVSTNKDGYTSLDHEVLTDMLRTPCSLDTMSLCSFSLSSQCFDTFRHCLLREENSIKTIIIDSCHAESSEESLSLMFAAIPQSSSLKNIALPRIPWTHGLCDCMNKCLLSSTTLKCITLGDAGSTLGIARLSRIFASTKVAAKMLLRSLRLVNLSLTESDMVYLVYLLKMSCRSLRFLEIGFCESCSILDRPPRDKTNMLSRRGLIRFAEFVQAKTNLLSLALSDGSIRFELSRVNRSNHWRILKLTPTADDSWQPSVTHGGAVFWYLNKLHFSFPLNRCDLSKCPNLNGVMTAFVPIATQSLELHRLITYGERQCSWCSLRETRILGCSRCAMLNFSSERPQAQHVACLLRLNRAGRSYLRINPAGKVFGVSVLGRVNDDLDCIYMHLRENPVLCCRDIEVTSRS